MDKQQYLRLIDYDSWANERIMSTLLRFANRDAISKARSLFSHIVAAEEVWLARIQSFDYTTMSFWPEINPEEWSPRLDNIRAAWLRVINDTALQKAISYQNSKGNNYITRLDDILIHVCIHGQHHRAQIALQIRQAGWAPPPTDFIYFTRDEISNAE